MLAARGATGRSAAVAGLDPPNMTTWWARRTTGVALACTVARLCRGADRPRWRNCTMTLRGAETDPRFGSGATAQPDPCRACSGTNREVAIGRYQGDQPREWGVHGKRHVLRRPDHRAV